MCKWLEVVHSSSYTDRCGLKNISPDPLQSRVLIRGSSCRRPTCAFVSPFSSHLDTERAPRYDATARVCERDKEYDSMSIFEPRFHMLHTQHTHGFTGLATPPLHI